MLTPVPESQPSSPWKVTAKACSSSATPLSEHTASQISSIKGSGSSLVPGIISSETITSISSIAASPNGPTGVNDFNPYNNGKVIADILLMFSFLVASILEGDLYNIWSPFAYLDMTTLIPVLAFPTHQTRGNPGNGNGFLRELRASHGQTEKVDKSLRGPNA